MSEQFKEGDQVRIVGINHPWRGEAGEIVGACTYHPALDWEVKIQLGGIGGEKVCAAASSELRPA